MTDLFYAVLKASFHGSVVILAVIALRLLLKKAPKSLFCLLWLLAGLRMALPFEIQSNLSLQPRLEETNLGIQVERPVQVPDILIQSPEGEPLDVPAQTPDLPEGNRENVQTDSFLHSVENGVIKPIRYGDIAVTLWLAGMAIMLAVSVCSYLRLKRRVREAYLIEKGCFECAGLETAFVLGFFSPKIYLPKGLAEQEKRFIYDHENTHIARGDNWSKMVGYLVLTIHWFNPLVWLAYHLLCRDMELACDEHVVRNMTLPERKAYSAALLSCGSHTSRLAACPVAFGESNPRRRIMNVLNYKRPTFWISLLAVIAVIFVSVCLLTSPKNQEEAPPEEELSWNLKMKVSDVTSTGLTVEFIQQGPFKGYDRAELQFGSHYTLQRQENGQWVDVEMLPQEHDIGWTMEAYIIKRDDTTRQHIDWEWLYGALPTGHYRIGKTVSLFRSAGNYDEQIFYAEFVVFEDSAWNMEKTGEEYLEMCRNAVAEFQSRENYHVTEILVYYTNNRETGREHASYWHHGDDWAWQFYAARTEETRTNLYYQGDYCIRVQKENEVPRWDLFGDTDYGRCSEPWLSRLDWDAQQITFVHVEQVGDLLHIFLTVHAAPEFDGYENVTAYTVGFFFDQSGNLHTAIMGGLDGVVHMMSDLRIQTTQDNNIREKLDMIAAERFAELIHCDDPDCTDTTHDHYGIACTVEHCTNPAHGHGDDHHH